MLKRHYEDASRSLMGDLKRRLWAFVKMQETVIPTSPSVASRAFHGDHMYQELVTLICFRLNVSSFVETGTYLGDTTEFMAKTVTVPIHTCEVKQDLFDSSAERLRRYGHVRGARESSDTFIRRAVSHENLGTLPLFYLDAHWYDYWPLLDEIELITSKLPRCIIIIDDFQVPGRNEYAFCVGGGGSAEFSGRATIDERVCNFDLIRTRLSHPSHYELLYPRYHHQHAFGNSQSGALIGYVAIFKNLIAEFECLTELQFIKDNFSSGSVE